MTSTLTLLLLLAGAPQAPKVAPVPAVAADDERPPALEPDVVEGPPGSPEDQALWLGLRAATNRATFTIARIGQAGFRIKYGRYYEELDRRGAQPDGAEAKVLVAQLTDVARRARSAIPVAPRVYPCRHTLLDLEQRMGQREHPTLGKELPQVRGEARACLTRIEGYVGPIVDGARDLEETLDRIDAYLLRNRPAAPAGVKAPSAQEAARILEASDR
jgi:hypothetical protein